MGSMIYLSLGKLEIDWGKNSVFNTYNSLYQSNDVKPIPYYYVNNIVEMKEGLSKSLIDVRDRISLLGYTTKVCEKNYYEVFAFADADVNVLPYESFKESLRTVDVSTLSAEYESGYDLGKFFVQEISERIAIRPPVNEQSWVMRVIGEALENYPPLCLLMLLSENQRNLSINVNWGYADVAENWVEYEDFQPNLNESERFLIVTEGSSDSKILKHALSLLKPHIADFFRFVDMEENYPFTGTGNLYRFTQGLVSIGISNKIVVLYDNDAEGIYNFERTKELNPPLNMRIARLPDMEAFQCFPAIGPEGETDADINGCAASIECYLDLEKTDELPKVRWTSWNKHLQRYHGVIETKRDTMLSFLQTTSKDSDYDFTKIEIVLDHIISECVKIAETENLKGYSKA